MNHNEVLMEHKYMCNSLTQALTTLSGCKRPKKKAGCLKDMFVFKFYGFYLLRVCAIPT